MRIEFKTVFDNFANEELAKIYVQHFMDAQMKKYKNIIIFSIIVALICCVSGFALKQFYIIGAGLCYATFVIFMIYHSRKKVLPKTFIDANGIGCPYNVTIGLYDEYFYEKFEGNMSISEHSIRYEFLKKVVETPEYFVLMSNRSQLFFLPKRDMGYNAVLEFSAFCKTRLSFIYSFKG